MNLAARSFRSRLSRPVSISVGVLACLVIVSLLALPPLTTAQKPGSPADAWERARRAGTYHFSADIRQTVTPRPSLLTVGRGSKQ